MTELALALMICYHCSSASALADAKVLLWYFGGTSCVTYRPFQKCVAANGQKATGLRARHILTVARSVKRRLPARPKACAPSVWT